MLCGMLIPWMCNSVPFKPNYQEKHVAKNTKKYKIPFF